MCASSMNLAPGDAVCATQREWKTLCWPWISGENWLLVKRESSQKKRDGWGLQWRKRKCLPCGRITFRGKEKTRGGANPSNVASQKLKERRIRARNDSFLSSLLLFTSIPSLLMKHLSDTYSLPGVAGDIAVRIVPCKGGQVRGLWRLQSFAQMTINDQRCQLITASK